MRYVPPGLDEPPDDSALVGFASLMPEPERTPGFLRRLARLPVKLIALPFRAVGWFLGVPGRLLRSVRGLGYYN
jgi:hypothetical protein